MMGALSHGWQWATAHECTYLQRWRKTRQPKTSFERASLPQFQNEGQKPSSQNPVRTNPWRYKTSVKRILSFVTIKTESVYTLSLNCPHNSLQQLGLLIPAWGFLNHNHSRLYIQVCCASISPCGSHGRSTEKRDSLQVWCSFLLRRVVRTLQLAIFLLMKATIKTETEGVLLHGTCSIKSFCSFWYQILRQLPGREKFGVNKRFRILCNWERRSLRQDSSNIIHLVKGRLPSSCDSACRHS